MKRRNFLTALSAPMLPGVESVLARLAFAQAPGPALARFDPIVPSDADELILPEGFGYDVMLKWGDPFTASGELFGYNNDWIGVFPLKDDQEALLAVNHEYLSFAYEGDAPLYPSSFAALRGRVPTLDDYKRDVGMSVLRVRQDGATGAWVPVLGDPLNRRLDGTSPCTVDGPAASVLGGGPIEGTLANCGGQTTPWMTALSCEENYQDVVPDLVDAKGHSAKGGMFGLRGNDYGWVVEVDPYDPGSIPVKHTALGRFRHENVGLRAEPGKPLAGYMGDDRLGGHIWKFVSHDLYNPADRIGNRRLLSAGRLYAARFNPDGTGEWRLLDLETSLDPNPDPKDPKPFIPAPARKLAHCYETQGAVLIDAYQAANAIGASPSGRPEYLKVHPADGSVFIAFTAASGRAGPWTNAYGEVWRLEDDKADVRATRFRWSRFAVGASDPARAGRTFTQPDNLLFDARGDLWVTSDISSHLINEREDYRVFKNAGLFRIPVGGPDRAQPAQFASMPCESEPTGPAWAPAEQALFLSIQHPGERYGTRTESGQSPRGSNWPHNRLGTPPQPAIVAIRRK